MIHAGDHEEAKVVGDTVARRLLDGGAVICDVTIGSARPCLLPFQGYAAGNLRVVLPMQARPTSPVMLVHLFETREEAESGGSVVKHEIGRLWGLEITFRRPTMDCVAHPAGALPWN